MPYLLLMLDEALRGGEIVRGIALDEAEVAMAEMMATAARRLVLQSGD